MANGHGGKREGAGRKPGQVSAAKKEIAGEAKQYAAAALATLVRVMGDEEAPHSAQVSAANAVLDRAYGKPPQAIVGDDDNPVRVVTEIVLRAAGSN